MEREMAEKKSTIARKIVDDYLDAAIDFKVNHYFITFSLYRYRKYSFMLLVTKIR